MSNFYDAFSGEYSKASFNYKSDGKSNNLPGLAYAQGHSIRNIHQPRAMLPVLGRDGYKNILVYRIDDGSARNRTITQQDDLFTREYFVETDRIQRPRFNLSPPQNNTITMLNYRNYIDGVYLPTGDEILMTDLNLPQFNLLIQAIIDNDYDQYQKITVPTTRIFDDVFKSAQYVYLKYILGHPNYDVQFPDGGIQQVPNFRLFTQVLGDNGYYDKSTPYTDLMKFDPVEFVRGNAPPGMFPDVTPSSSYEGNMRRLFNGIIEPFNIRTEIYDLSTFAKTDKVKPNSVGGSVMQPIDSFSKISENLNAGSAPHIDISNSSSGGGLLEAEYIMESKFNISCSLNALPIICNPKG